MTEPPLPTPITLPLLPLRDVVCFPGIDTSLFLGSAPARRAAATAISADGRIAVVTRRIGTSEAATVDDLYPIGVAAGVRSISRLPDGTLKVVLYGFDRIAVCEVRDTGSYVEAEVRIVAEPAEVPPPDSRQLLESVAAQGPALRAALPDAVFELLPRLTNVGYLADLIGNHARGISTSSRQELLETMEPWERLRRSLAAVQSVADAGLDLPDAVEAIREWLGHRLKEPERDSTP